MIYIDIAVPINIDSEMRVGPDSLHLVRVETVESTRKNEEKYLEVCLHD